MSLCALRMCTFSFAFFINSTVNTICDIVSTFWEFEIQEAINILDPREGDNESQG